MDEPVPLFHFDTLGVPAGTELRAWGSLIPWFEVSSAGASDHPRVLADAWLLGAMVLSVTEMPPVRLERSSSLIDADGRNDYCVVVANSPWTVRLGEQPAVTVEPGSVCVLDSAQPFRVENAGGEFTILNVPRSILLDLDSPMELHGVFVRSTLAMVFGDFLVGLRSRLPTLAKRHAGPVERALRDLLISCLTAGGERCWSADGDGTVLGRAGRFVDGNLATALTVDAVAKAMGVSRSRLYRIFQEVGGVERFIVRRRLHRARSLLSHPIGRAPTIGEVAHATGFPSTTHFSRVFKVRYGVTPTQARRTGRSENTRLTAESEDARRFQSWFTPPPMR